ncbi:RNA-metabolising metallo-beta-lactamase [Nitratifractor salsuginis DSM 16511]|uniref:RNA-metabolising metallo-beta-lactamase n=2 Tax=Nitratifractor salsuginis TaxID=269261 RepID=E6X372_NITSE|nr:RNA-metabolising metallo-beta-lactamase [Nitratifractor salsuginis DSM 16511]
MKGEKMAILESHGADEVVTGSCHLLKLENGMRILVDCGMYQGREEPRNWEPFGFNPKKVDALLVTHAHLDHVGRIPKLVKEGFRGPIYATEATFELANIVLLDSAKLMEEDYRTRYKKAQRRGEEKDVRPPLYTVEDVENVWLRPTIHVKYGKWFRVGKGVRARYRNAGHILGSAFIEIEYTEGEGKKRIVFSGDLGNKVEVVMPRIEHAKIADNLVIESTYGDRDHRPLKESIKEFKKVVRDTLLNRGNVIIPSFAIERTQDLLCVLKQMYKDKELPYCKVFLDTPMGIRTTNVFNKYVDQLSPRCQKFYKEDGEVFQFPGLIFTPEVEDSKRINDVARGAIIIAGSGMCTGGRILHHFKHQIWNRRNAVIFVGYQAEGTIGREIVEGAKWIKIYHEDIRVRASIHTINGFSAHADQDELIDWMKAFKRLGNVFLVHGELEKQLVLKKVMKKRMKKEPIIVEEGKDYFLD